MSHPQSSPWPQSPPPGDAGHWNSSHKAPSAFDSSYQAQLPPPVAMMPPVRNQGMQYQPMQQNNIPLEHRPWVLIGYTHGYYSSAPVYGPPGAKFDTAGNIYILHPGNRKEYVVPYRGYTGIHRDPPSANDEFCGLVGMLCPVEPQDWQSTRFTIYNIPEEFRSTYYG